MTDLSKGPPANDSGCRQCGRVLSFISESSGHECLPPLLRIALLRKGIERRGVREAMGWRDHDTMVRLLDGLEEYLTHVAVVSR